MPTDPRPVSLAQIVKRAAEAVDPEEADADVADFQELFEDADEPVRAVGDETLDDRVEEAVRRIDPEGDLPQIAMAAAIVRYLAHKPGESADEDRDHLLRLAARAEYQGDPPPVVSDWLVDQGVAI